MSGAEDWETMRAQAQQDIAAIKHATVTLRAVNVELNRLKRRIVVGRWITGITASLATIAGILIQQWFTGSPACH